jgi:hypothetical protein
MTPKRAALLGLIFPVIAVIYVTVPTIVGAPVDWAGATMLIALGAAMALTAYVLVSGMQQRS